MIVLPPLDDVRRLVAQELPQGHELLEVEVVKDEALSQGTAPFTLIIRVREHPGAAEAPGIGYKLAKIFRKRWARDDIHVRLEWK